MAQGQSTEGARPDSARAVSRRYGGHRTTLGEAGRGLRHLSQPEAGLRRPLSRDRSRSRRLVSALQRCPRPVRRRSEGTPGCCGLRRGVARTRMTGRPSRICPACGGSSWDDRRRCKPCFAKRGREAWAKSTPEQRERKNALKRAWRAANPERQRAAERRQTYGISAETFDRMFEDQGGRCAICRQRAADCVDHDHATGKIRALLCMHCNAGLGLLRDDPSLLRGASAYLLKSE